MKKILPFFLLVLLLASCQKDPDMSKLSDDFVVFTDHNKDANFESFTTFYIPDSVMVIGSSEKPEFWSATEADDIGSTLVSGMEGRGYTRASDKESADLGLQVSFVKNVTFYMTLFFLWGNDEGISSINCRKIKIYRRNLFGYTDENRDYEVLGSIVLC